MNKVANNELVPVRTILVVLLALALGAGLLLSLGACAKPGADAGEQPGAADAGEQPGAASEEGAGGAGAASEEGAGSTSGEPEAAESSASAAPTEALSFTDDLGNSVTVKNPQRVVACMGSFAGAWELAGGTLVGASDDAFTDYDIASSGVEKVGDFSTLNLEAVIALEPDFVIMTGASTGRAGSASQVDFRDALVASAVPVAYFTVTTFADYERVFGVFCQITGRDDLYQQNCAEVAAKIAALEDEAEAASATPPRVLIMTTYSGGTRVQDSTTQTGAIFAGLGAINLADENPSLLKDFSLEAIIEMNPDFIFVIPMGNDPAAATKNLEEATAANPAWATLSAVQDGRYITLDAAHFLYKPNDRWAESYQIIFDYLYS